MDGQKLLKRDLFGEVVLKTSATGRIVVRNTGAAPWWTRWIARRLLQREARALAALDGMEGVPELISSDRHSLERSFLDGEPLYQARTGDAAWYRNAARLLRKLHRAGVCHNDLAKEPNLLVLRDGSPAFIDFQLAWYSRSRPKLFRVAAYEDLRHLLKHLSLIHI